MSHRRLHLSAALTLGFAFTLFSGCANPSLNDPSRVGPFFTPPNYSGDASLGGIRRVVVLPIWVGEGTPVESAAALEPVFLAALQQQKRFEVVPLSRETLRRRYQVDAFLSAAELPHDLFSMLKRDYGAEAVLFIDLTVFEPYKPLVLGLRGKLADINDARLIWTFDNLYSSEAPTAANSARHFYLFRDGSVPADLTQAALQSPSKFAAYAAASMFATLPPVSPPTAVIAK